MDNLYNDDLEITQISSVIGRSKKQKQILIGLGLNKIGRKRILKYTPAVEGMTNKVKHLIKLIKV